MTYKLVIMYDYFFILHQINVGRQRVEELLLLPFFFNINPFQINLVLHICIINPNHQNQPRRQFQTLSLRKQTLFSSKQRILASGAVK